MDFAVHDTLALVAMVLALGVKHGLDPDHLATIDGLTRYNQRTHPRLARWSGALFSLGHGIVVTLVAATIALTVHEWSAPSWLEHFGAAVSILFLLVLGTVNIRAVLFTPRGQIVRPSGVKGRWLGGLAQTNHPVVIAAVGAVFALSFDTWSQAALFSLSATQVAGWMFSAALGIVFMIGMLIADGLNGAWVAYMLNRADQRAVIASRIMSLTVGVLSLSIAIAGIVRYFSASWSEIAEHASLLLGFAVIALVFASFAIGMRLAASAGAAR